jgi:KDO2-lipid IV(A) lauroyltransferase
VRRRGGENFARARARGRGVLVLTAHLGNWDLLAVSEALAGADLAIVTRHQRARGVDAVWKAKRARLGVRQIGAGGARSARALLGHLRGGGVVGFVLDQHAGDAGVVVDFLGRPASTDPGLAALALASGAPVLPVFIRRLEDGTHEVDIGVEVPLAPGATRAARIAASTARFAAVVADAVRRTPEQWLWLHRRWKVAPATVATEPTALGVAAPEPAALGATLGGREAVLP